MAEIGGKYLERIVARAVIDDDDIKSRVILVQGTIKSAGQQAGSIVGGDD